MDLHGQKVLKVAIDPLWEAMDDPDLLARSAPGCKRLEAIGDGEYIAVVELGVAAVKGRYTARVRMSDKRREAASGSLHVALKGDGDSGFLTGEGDVRLETVEQGTRVSYEAAVTVGGRVAGVGQRVLRGIANMLIGQFFKSLEEELHSVRAAT